MLPRADIISVKPVGPVEAVASVEVAADARQEAFQRQLAGLLGKSMQAQVLAKLADGSFLVKVAGTPARMLLPAGVQVGAEVPMTLVAASPRPTFQLAGGQSVQAALAWLSGAAPAASAAPAGHALAAAALAGAPDPGEGGASLSAAARIITSILSTAHSVAGAPATLVGSTPLIGNAAPDPAQLAQRLQQTIAQSGLFYESHLAEWAGGERSLPELMREPQVHKAPGTSPADPETARFISLQLASHEQARVTWQGQLGPGQPMEWEIHRDAPERRGGDAGPEDTPAWRSGMRLRFALLGEIEATLAMRGDQLHIELKAGSSGIEGLLRAHADRLSGAMAAAGTPLSSLHIGPQAQAGLDD